MILHSPEDRPTRNITGIIISWMGFEKLRSWKWQG